MKPTPLTTAWLILAIVAISVVAFTVTGTQAKTPLIQSTAAVFWTAIAVRCSSAQRWRPSKPLLLSSIGTGLVGTLGQVHLLQQIAAAICLTAACGGTAFGFLLAGAVCWLPITDYLLGDAAMLGRLGGVVASLPALTVRHRTAMPAISLTVKRHTPLMAAFGLAVVALALFRANPAHAPSHLADLPHSGLIVRSAQVPLRPDESVHLADVETIKRRYRLPSGQFDLLAIDGETNRHAVHDPTFCHRGAGWTIVDRQTLPLSRGNAAWVEYSRGAESTQCVFWFTNGRTQSASPFWYWATATLRRITAGQSGAEPVLVVLQPTGPTSPDWSQLFAEFPALKRF